ncbi:DUF2336 domain-containing protein [Zymomonas mobilis]|uniref:DUF2336 domain-containing protein n=1 Tax=Zymomonas mobilis subsp. mobilis (strain ATCC 10988 / DSM 424 / LMG 404 / NCIMB 8938 / NRRL B-806 / ZM1) TaxID=555217 RepID=A0A0H3FZH3_ZYMMA|nr:DUF2336 domain-containing protein [Zymomonas mobilis]AEH63057.1 Protein of unknown function DUF2336 [Zymomonas mobilis subsp. mobilis ATCC 10988]TQL27333.1 uncharacterized protein (DUF2336 family) [Zymomonas mobilis]TQL29274.1 uncharacterized protein (DUF2336 family) [Zymomonas mobilis]
MVAEKHKKETQPSLIEYARDALIHERKRKKQIYEDLLIPTSLRLNEIERYHIIKIFEHITIAAENEIRLYLVDLLEDDAPLSVIMLLNDPTKHLTLEWLSDSILLRDQTFVAMLIRRMRTSFLQKNCHKKQYHKSPKNSDIIDSLIGQMDADIALSAMVLLIAESRQISHLNNPILSRTDLSAELQYKLLWWVAACLRSCLLEAQLSEEQVDQALSKAVRQALTQYDEGSTLEARALKLARHLHKYRKLSDEFILQSAMDGHTALMVAALAIRSGVNHHYIWDIVLNEDESPLLLLLKAIGMPRQIAASLAFQLTGHSLDNHQIAEKVKAFEALSQSDADKALALWRLDECYRESICEIENRYKTAREKKAYIASPDFFQQDCL